MAKKIVGHIDLNGPEKQERINFPKWALDLIRAEGVGKIVVSFDTDTLRLSADPVSEDVK